MTSQQLDMLTEEVMANLNQYIDIVGKNKLMKEKIHLLHGLFEYMLTPNVKSSIFMREIFKNFTAMIIKKIAEYRMCVLVQENENLMKAMDELELYIHDLAVARGGRGVKRCRETGPHTGLMTYRNEIECQAATHGLTATKGNDCNIDYRRRSARLINKKEGGSRRHEGSVNVIV